MYTVTVETSFTASHQLRLGDGTFEPLHNHNWQIRAAVTAQNLDKLGLAIDFNKLMNLLDSILAPMKDKKLETLVPFQTQYQNTSAELVAKYIFDSLKPLLPPQTSLAYIEVMEAPNCWAKYSER
ncbi:MAG: hypothetical protein A2Y07_00290 [Planctomycetes bacterium GWF2_50_10]|nr:MAG: hypothetical protein A2Y07_00290 [Planctomycetes bacterium GWF2_50_10]